MSPIIMVRGDLDPSQLVSAMADLSSYVDIMKEQIGSHYFKISLDIGKCSPRRYSWNDSRTRSV